MSALPPIADMCGALAHVCFVPIADIPRLTQSPHRRSAGDTPTREAQRLRGLKFDNKLILRRRLHRHVCGLFAFEDAIDVTGRLPPHVDAIGPIGEQAAGGDEGAIEVDRGQLVPRRKRDDQIAMKQRRPARGHDQTPGTFADSDHGYRSAMVMLLSWRI